MSEHKKSGPCNCDKCAALCHGKPGWFMPGQATKAAAEIGVTLASFFKSFLTRDFFVADYDADNEGDHSSRVYLLSPAWAENNGRTAGYNDVNRRGACALLGSSGCRLSFENRPLECQTAYGCEPTGRVAVFAQQTAIVAAWKSEPHEFERVEFDPDFDGGDAPPHRFGSLFGGYFTR